MKKLLLFALLLTFFHANSQENKWFKTRDFGKYFAADHFAPISKLGFGWSPLADDYIVYRTRESGGQVLYNETCVGTEIPLWTKTTKKAAYSISLPVSFVIWMDITEPITAPVINTDYRFAAPEFNYLRKFDHPRFRNLGMKIYPLFHESTHLGDELTISRMQDSFPITRVNLSYELAEIAFQLNDPLNSLELNHSFKIGSRFLLSTNRGWYYTLENETDTLLVPKSKRTIEPYVQYHFQAPSKMKILKQQLLFDLSFDLRYRIQFSYPVYQFGSNGDFKETIYPETYKPCLNTFIGFRFISPEEKLSNVGIYLRAYYGLNYHGQFRNIPGHYYLGGTLVYHN